MLELSRVLNSANIDASIASYLEQLDEIPVTITAENVLSLLVKLKRDKIGAGPYPDVSIFESSNRIMTDLVILYGIRILFEKYSEVLDFDEYRVEFGTENRNAHDILAAKNGRNLHGEAFNVAPSFFQAKKAKTLKKLRDGSATNDFLLIAYNSDAVPDGYTPTIIGNEIHLPVKINNWK